MRTQADVSPPVTTSSSSGRSQRSLAAPPYLKLALSGPLVLTVTLRRSLSPPFPLFEPDSLLSAGTCVATAEAEFPTETRGPVTSKIIFSSFAHLFNTNNNHLYNIRPPPTSSSGSGPSNPRPRDGKPPPPRPRTEDSDSNGAAFTTLRVAKYGPPIVQCNDRRKQHASYTQANGYVPNLVYPSGYRPRGSSYGRPPPPPPLPPHRPYPSSLSFEGASRSSPYPSPPAGPRSYETSYQRQHWELTSNGTGDVPFVRSSYSSYDDRPSAGGDRRPYSPERRSFPTDRRGPRVHGNRRDRSPSLRSTPQADQVTAEEEHLSQPAAEKEASVKTPVERAKKKAKKRKLSHATTDGDGDSPDASAKRPAIPPSLPPRPPSPAFSPPPETASPAPKLVFKPNKPKGSKKDVTSHSQSLSTNAHSSSSRQLSPQSHPPHPDENSHRTDSPRAATHLRFESEDRKPTLAELEAAGSVPEPEPEPEEDKTSGVWAFKKHDTPAACWSKNGAEKTSARHAFKMQKKAELKRMGRKAEQTMWRDDGFALTWTIPEPQSGAPVASTSANPATSAARPAKQKIQPPKATPPVVAPPRPTTPPLSPPRRQSSITPPSSPAVTKKAQRPATPPLVPPAPPPRTSSFPVETTPSTQTPAMSVAHGDTKPVGSTQTLEKLELEIQNDLTAIDRWTTMQREFPRQADTLARQIDRVQSAIFAKFSQVEAEKARLAKGV